MKNLRLKIRHFALDTLREIKIWYYAIIGKFIPTPLRDDSDANEIIKWGLEFGTPSDIIARRKQLIQIAKPICIYFVLPVLAGVTVWLIIQSISTP